jgi:hypothetical protein
MADFSFLRKFSMLRKHAIVADVRVFTSITPLLTVCFDIVTGSADGLQVRPFNPQRIGNAVERKDVVNVVRWCVVAHLADGLSIPFESADPVPMLVITALLIRAACCVTFGPAFSLPEYSW